MPEPSPATLSGPDVRAVRERLGLSQVEFAAVLGLSRGTSVSELETGARPVSATLARLVAFVERYGPAPPAAGDTPGLAAHAATLRSIAAQLEAAASAPGA